MSKAKVDPIKCPTLPQLELTAINLAARLISFARDSICHVFNQCSIHIWCDSQEALCWLYTTNPVKSFVKLRVDNISNLEPDATFHYIKSVHNPADMLSRGTTEKKFVSSTIWFQGSSVLRDETLWVKFVLCNIVHQGALIAFEDGISQSVACITNNELPSFVTTFVSKFSSHNRLLRVLAHVRRFIINVQCHMGS